MTSSFTTKLILEPNDDGCTWTLVHPFIYSIGDLQTGEKIEIPAGFVTDFASVPRFLWWLYPAWGKYGKAAVVHDFLYNVPGVKTRRQCDDIFLEGMEVLRVPRLRRWLIYRGVRLGGWYAWGGHRAKRLAKQCDESATSPGSAPK